MIKANKVQKTIKKKREKKTGGKGKGLIDYKGLVLIKKVSITGLIGYKGLFLIKTQLWGKHLYLVNHR